MAAQTSVLQPGLTSASLSEGADLTPVQASVLVPTTALASPALTCLPAQMPVFPLAPQSTADGPAAFTWEKIPTGEPSCPPLKLTLTPINQAPDSVAMPASQMIFAPAFASVPLRQFQFVGDPQLQLGAKHYDFMPAANGSTQLQSNFAADGIRDNSLQPQPIGHSERRRLFPE